MNSASSCTSAWHVPDQASTAMADRNSQTVIPQKIAFVLVAVLIGDASLSTAGSAKPHCYAKSSIASIYRAPVHIVLAPPKPEPKAAISTKLAAPRRMIDACPPLSLAKP